MDFSLRMIGKQAMSELSRALDAIAEVAADELVTVVLRARRIAVHGLGREGLMMRAFAMRLYHLGLNVHVVGDMTVPPLGPGDLLLTSCGPGALTTVDALIEVARGAGATVAVVTAQPDGPTSQLADFLTVLPSQTMADDLPGSTATSPVLPMGSLFEITQLLFFELVVIALRDRTGQTSQSMRSRHTNLE
jgi:6-phospho-3-hexuloisomerase